MRVLLSVMVLLVVAVCGCARKGALLPPTTNSTVVLSGQQKLIVTPETVSVGRVVRVNSAGQFVVLEYPLGRLPARELRFNLYRRGLKVGEIKIVGPQTDEHIVADLVGGDAQLGDEARSQ